jgi:hypothetical protein
MSQLCDGIQCRLIARTAGIAKGEILDWELGKKQTDQVQIRKSIKRGQNNKLQTVSDTEQDTLLSSVGSFSSEQSPKETVMKLNGPDDSCVVCVNWEGESEIILKCKQVLLSVGLTAEIENTERNLVDVWFYL